MKKLSTEEKAKRYDEAIEKAKKVLLDCTPEEQKVVEYISPELKESEDDRIRKDLIIYLRSILSNKKYGDKFIEGWIAWLEKQGEQKPVDKVEPKFNFKVGQWIVATGKCVYLIAKIDVFNVTLIDTNGDEYVFDASSLNDAHEWTIQDAKDGDVLSCREGQWCFIYKEIIYDNIFKYYALLSEKGITVNDAVFNLLSSCITPATKIQRGLLFQKMKEAGYEWSDKDRKLIKIVK